VVGIGGIDIVETAIDGIPDQPDGFFLIDGTVRKQREPHASESKRGNLYIEFAEFSVLHSFPPLVCLG
jgi:hypothetical protein